jgi:hypothetical protein
MPTVAGATVSFSTKETGPITSAVAWTLDRKTYVIHGSQKGDTYTFPLPEAECSSVVLVGAPPPDTGQVRVVGLHTYDLRPVVEWSVDRPATYGSHRALLLKVTNPNATPMLGKASLRLPAGWPAASTVTFGPLAPGESAQVQVPFVVGLHATKGRADLWCDVTGWSLPTPLGVKGWQVPGHTFSAYDFITVNDPVLLDIQGSPGYHHIWLKNLSTHPVTGTVEVSAPAPLKVSCPPTFEVAPESETQVPVTVEGRAGLHEISEMQARVTIAGKTTEVVRGVPPIVANPDFEMDGAGDLQPDWWQARKFQDVWAYEHKRLSTDAHSGKYSLEVDPPQAGEKFIRVYPVDGAFSPSTKYQVSVWIKSEANKDVWFYIGGLVLGSGQTGPEWKQFTGTFTSAPDPINGGWANINAYNASTGKAWFDDIVVEEVK